jgi:hypothetical protein
MIEDGEADVAHPHLIDVGKGQGHADRDPGAILADAPGFAAQIAGRAGDQGQNLGKTIVCHVIIVRFTARTAGKPPPGHRG